MQYVFVSFFLPSLKKMSNLNKMRKFYSYCVLFYVFDLLLGGCMRPSFFLILFFL